MAIVPVSPIGARRADFCDDRTFADYREQNAAREALLAQRRAEVKRGWGDKYAARVHDKGKLTTRERIERLRDPNSELFEVGTFVNYGHTFGEQGLTSPAAGVVTAFVQVEGRWCMVIANDNTVASGSWWPQTPEKIQRAQTMALRSQARHRLMTGDAGIIVLDGNAIEIEGVGFTGVRGFAGGFGRWALSPFGESLIKSFVAEAVEESLKLERGLQDLRSEHRIVLLHYAPITDTLVGEPEQIYPFLGSSRLLQPIETMRPDVVFHGHAHHGTYRGATPSGIPVFNVAMHVLEREGVGLHIHEVGDCSAPDATSAKGHFNPTGKAASTPPPTPPP